MEFVGKILVLLALAGIAAIEVYHKEENTGLMNLILVLIAAVVGWLLPKNDHVLSMIAAVASFAALYLSAHAAGRAVQHAAHHCGVEFRLQRDGKIDAEAEQRGAERAVGRIEQKAAAHNKPAQHINRRAEQGIPDQGGERVGPVIGQQGEPHDAPGQKAVGRGHALNAQGHEQRAQSEPEQVPPDGPCALDVVGV